jgi:predicted O-methyltransferase YrrM
MYGNFVSRSVRGLAHMLRRPGHGARWVRDRVSKASPLDLQLPWFSWGAIELLDGFELGGRRVFEYGGGGSTLYFLGRGARVRTAENSPAWAELIAQRAKTVGFEQRLDLRVVEMPEHPTAAERALTERYIEQIESEQPYRLIVVDGVDGTPSTRMACLERARRSLEPGGAIVLDDAWRHEYEPAPRILAGLEQRICVGLGPARWGVTRTDVYISRD